MNGPVDLWNDPPNVAGGVSGDVARGQSRFKIAQARGWGRPIPTSSALINYPRGQAVPARVLESARGLPVGKIKDRVKMQPRSVSPHPATIQ